MKSIPILSTRGLLVLGMLVSIVGLYILEQKEGAAALGPIFGMAVKALYDERDVAGS